MQSFENWLLLHEPSDFFSIYERNILKEGLTTSYPIESTRRSISELEGFLELGKVEDNNRFNVRFKTDPNAMAEFMANLNNWLFTYGYFITTIVDYNGTDIIFTVEMKYPTKVPESIVKNGDWFHVTNSQYVDKIKQIGLGPRGSTTNYIHPENRIYLIHIDGNNQMLNSLARTLFQNKLKALQRSNKSGIATRIHNWENSHMVLLKVELDETFEVFYDPAFEKHNDYIAGFTMKYIKPTRIEIVKDL